MKIFNNKEQEFIEKNLNSDINKLLLSSRNKDNDIDIRACAIQIEGRNKAKDKFPFLLNYKDIIYPPKLNIEQASSQETAIYKASLFDNNKTLRDLTSGFGIDDIFFAKELKKIYYHEENKDLLEIANLNFKKLSLRNIELEQGDSIISLKNAEKTDIIYLDPSRRDENKERVFSIRDSKPNVIDLIPLLFEKADIICLKLSPLMDIKLAERELQYTKEIHIISVRNECKEMVFILDKVSLNKNAVKYYAVDIYPNKNIIFSFTHHSVDIPFIKDFNNKIGYYLYEPNSSVMKSVGYNYICEKYSSNLEKLSAQSHLFISNKMIEDFCGRSFLIKDILPYNKNTIKDISLAFPKANITIRNFPISVSEIRKKTKISEGGEDYLFFSTDNNNIKIIFICEKVF